jgi:hypothetical protein
VEWTEAFLERIDKLEPAVKAWVHLDREGALRTAARARGAGGGGRRVGPLHGVPVAPQGHLRRGRHADARGREGLRASANPIPTRPRWRALARRAR